MRRSSLLAVAWRQRVARNGMPRGIRIGHRWYRSLLLPPDGAATRWLPTSAARSRTSLQVPEVPKVQCIKTRMNVIIL